MSDIARTDLTDFTIHRTEEARRRLARRYATERRFKTLGLAAVLSAMLALALLLSTIVTQAIPAFTMNYATLPVTLSGEHIDSADLGKSDFDAVVNDAIDAALPFAEGRREPDRAPAEAASGRTAWITGLAAGALLFGFFFVTGPPAGDSSWATRGAAVSRSMLNGEPWRAVTALTLHVDLVHVLGNAIATALLLPPIIRRLGPGIGLALVLLAGAAANLLGGWVQGPRHVAVGASTATFGALGILAALRLGSPSPAGRARGRRWIVPVASLLLLAMLGTGPGTDVLAHALGLVVGAALGLLAAIVRRPVAPPIQRALVAAVVLVVLGCWCAALASPPS